MRGAVAALALALVVSTFSAVRAGEPSAARMPVYGTIVSVDRTHGTVVLQHTALETMPAGKKRCRFRHAADVKKLRPGTIIEASADTRHIPWTLDRVRVRT
jgi:Cu/Ag efflux protein CusF